MITTEAYQSIVETEDPEEEETSYPPPIFQGATPWILAMIGLAVALYIGTREDTEGRWNKIPPL